MDFLDKVLQDLSLIDLKEIIGSFVILFVAIDIIGAIPVVLNLKDRGQSFHSGKATTFSCVMMLAFLFIGEPMLNFFGVDVIEIGRASCRERV